jgi:hypothetical protein
MENQAMSDEDYQSKRLRLLLLLADASLRNREDIQQIYLKALDDLFRPNAEQNHLIDLILSQGLYFDYPSRSWKRATECEPDHADHETPAREAVLHQIRKALNHGPLSQEALIEAVTAELSVDDEEVRGFLPTASRRGAVERMADGSYRILDRSISGLDRSFLKKQLLASLHGTSWQEERAVIYNFTRYLGWGRTGHVIRQETKSLITGLLREGRLERSRTYLRKVA